MKAYIYHLIGIHLEREQTGLALVSSSEVHATIE